MHDVTNNSTASSYDSHLSSQSDITEYGRRLLPSVVDAKAASGVESIWCSLPHDDNDLSKGFEDINYWRLANAVNKMAWLIHDKLGPSQNFDTIIYMGIPDIRYQIIEIAVIKTGHKVLFSSHMNSVTGHLALMDKTNAQIMLSASTVKVNDILLARPVRHEIIPELDDLLNAHPVEEYPYLKTFDEAKDDPFLILHTSGTTGAPKPIECTLGSMAVLDHHQSLPVIDPVSGFPIRSFFTRPAKSDRMLVPFLPFHGIVSLALWAGVVYGGVVWLPGFRHKMTTTDDIPSILTYCNADIGFFSPAMVEDLARRSDVGQYLSGLKKVLYGGAAITESAGKVFSKYTHIQSQWGITETTTLVQLEADPEDFAYCGFELEASGTSFEPVTDDLYEMVVRRTPASFSNVAIFWRDPNMDTFHPGDVWSPHPDPKKAKYFWVFRGRTDDLITWKDGTNFQPTNYESKHSEHEAVKSAIMAGTGHRQPILLLETYQPQLNEAALTTTLDKIWEESVVPINQIAPTNGKVAKTHIIIATIEKPFERNVKGSVARKATIRMYESEIEAVYRQYGDEAVGLNQRFD